MSIHQIVVNQNKIKEYAEGAHDTHIATLIGGLAASFRQAIAQAVAQNEVLATGFALEYKLDVTVKPAHEVPTISALPDLKTEPEAQHAHAHAHAHAQAHTNAHTNAHVHKKEKAEE